MILAIISHTAHYKTPQGEIVGWGPTVTEINHLLPVFDKIYHCAFLHKETPPGSSLPYKSPDIEFIPLPPSGGKGLQKFTVFTNLPSTIKTVHQILKKADIFQFRAPTGFGLYMIPYLVIMNRKKGWFKYAGNWIEEHPPLGYALQRWMLKLQSRKVTINGSWKDQPDNILTFENPCLTQKDRKKGKEAIGAKSFEGGLKVCFVGNLTRKKGFDLLMEALLKEESKFEQIHVVGNGPLAEDYKIKYPKAIFHGFLPKEKVQEVYLKCHFVVLPSLSEGFPKVIAEGMNYGCIPIVSDVSGISQFIKDGENGFLINPITRDNLNTVLGKVFEVKNSDFQNFIKINYRLASRFTFVAYLQNIRNRIL